MKGIKFSNPATGDTYSICRKCWESGARLAHINTMTQLELQGIYLRLQTTEGAIRDCKVCKRSVKDIN